MVTLYDMQLNTHRCPQMVKEKEFEYPRLAITDAEEAVQMLDGTVNLNRKTEEYVYMLALDITNVPIGMFQISHGTISMAPLNAREVYLRALICNAYSIIVAHNHPSGNIIPSRPDDIA